MGRRLVKQEDGFTLVEMLVTIMVMIVVMFALYSIFDMSIRVFSFGNNKVEAVENARIGLERMEREIRAAYPIDKPAGNDQVFTTWTQQKIAFGNDTDGDGRITCSTNCERISYEVFEDPDSSGRYSLGRSSTAAGTLQPTVESLDYTSSTDTGLRFTYFQKNGTTEVIPGSGDEKTIALVRVDLKIKVKSGQQDGIQTLSTDVALRNRGNGVASAPSGGVAPQCDNGEDDDNDTLTDLAGGDPGCDSATDNDETDPAAPDTTINSGPSDPTTSTSADFAFTSNVSGATFECRMDGGSWGGCTSPKSYTGLPSGSHTFNVRAKDSAGNVDASPASRTWTVSNTAAPALSPDGSNASRIEIRQGGSNKNNPLTIDVLDNDTGTGLNITSVTQPTIGSRVTITPDKKAVVYDADNGSGDRGNWRFKYTVTDNVGRTATTDVFVRVVNN